jgi:hypothetical protein
MNLEPVVRQVCVTLADRQDVLLDRNDLKWIKELITKVEEEACW